MSGQPILSWERREKWCRQFVEAVAAVHRQGKVLGSLGIARQYGVGIDTDDNLILWKGFCTTVFYEGRNIDMAVVPPEYDCPLPTIGQRIPIVPEIDLYQLGFVLWQLATNTKALPENCMIPCCNHSTCVGSVCFSFHFPSVGAPLPQYLEEIIRICLAENPTRRKRAVELLELIPAIREEGREAGSAVVLTPPAENDARCFAQPKDLVAVAVRISCDACQKTTTAHYYHCRFCSSGDLDLCASCFAQGRHCLDPNHYLMEIQSIGGTSEEKSFAGATDGGHRYFTNPKGDGHRDSVFM